MENQNEIQAINVLAQLLPLLPVPLATHQTAQASLEILKKFVVDNSPKKD
jgi:hypothetical protein